MLKIVRRRVPEKDKLGHNLFQFSKITEHGFPHKPSAFAYDPKLQLLAIGTQAGVLKIYGQPGVELTAHDSSAPSAIQQLFFLAGQGRIISVCDDGEQNSLHLWEMNNDNGKTHLDEVNACILEGRLKKISVCCLSMARDCLYIGTEGGHIYVLDLNTFGLKDHVIYQDIVMQSLSGDASKISGGSVEALREHPADPAKLLIGYKKGVMVLWNQDKIKAEGTFHAAHHDVEDCCWHPSGKKFISAHEQGSLSIWTVPDRESGDVLQETSTPFGPFPCKAIRKVEWHDPMVIFSGGLPRASYGDKHCVSIIQGNTVQVVLDFTSKVLDFFTIKEPGKEKRDPVALAVLCEEELVVVDLKNRDCGFPCYDKPYLACLHSSNITSTFHLFDCPDDLWKTLHVAGEKQSGGGYSHEPWPVMGGKCISSKSDKHGVLLTGHEDGSVRFWDVSGVLFHLIYTIYTGKLFASDFDSGPAPEAEDEEDWPPFKKVGAFDPFADDPRFCVQKLLLCRSSRLLVVGGSGGQIIVYDLSQDTSKSFPEMIDINVIHTLEGFQWKGLGPLSFTSATHNPAHGPIPKTVLQLKPSAPITALAMEPAWGLIAAGTCHGFILFDIITGKTALVKCTVNPTDLANTGAGIQRKRTLAKSLRDSFRRLRSRRGSRKSGRQKEGGAVAAASPTPGSPSVGVRSTGMEVGGPSRLVDENRVDEELMSMVRCLYFGDTFLGDAVNHSPTLWAGTNAGYIYVYSIILPGQDRRHQTPIKAECGKELKLKHHAPVMFIFVVDKNGNPLPSVSDAETGRAPEADMTGQHSLVIASEEQFKVFALPTLRPKNKEKITAVDGSRVRKLGIINVPVKDDEQEVAAHCMLCLTNQGDASIYSIPQLKVQMKRNVMKKEDISAIQSLIFTRNGEGFFLKSPSEMQRFSLLTSNTVKCDALIELAPGMRTGASADNLVEQNKTSRKGGETSGNGLLGSKNQQVSPTIGSKTTLTMNGDKLSREPAVKALSYSHMQGHS